MPTEWQLVVRLLLAAGLAGALGVEREVTEQPAGFRTHMLVGLGAGLFAILSAYGFVTVLGDQAAPSENADVTRIASQIVVGIGFLGGGAIIKYGAGVRGLTTAASLWVTAAIGTAVGLGAFVLATVTTALVLLALVGGRPLRNMLHRWTPGKEEFVIEADPGADVQAMVAKVRALGVRVEEMHLSEDDDRWSISLRLRVPPQTTPPEILQIMTSEPHVRHVEWAGG
jgi:putative Mg2+ transporter-C (MgtC) family protein